MSRVRDFGRDAAYYFGFGEGSSRIRDSQEPKETWLELAVRLIPPLIAALVLRGVLGLDDDLIGFALTLALVAPLAVAWLYILRLAGR